MKVRGRAMKMVECLREEINAVVVECEKDLENKRVRRLYFKGGGTHCFPPSFQTMLTW